MMTDLKSLIAELEQAKEGSRGLDAKIAEDVVWEEGRGKHLRTLKRGFYETARSLCEHYTTSLDAKLPGETIIRVKMIAITTDNPWGWEAVHSQYGLANNSKYFVGRGHTEALARRIAALKARETA